MWKKGIFSYITMVQISNLGNLTLRWYFNLQFIFQLSPLPNNVLLNIFSPFHLAAMILESPLIGKNSSTCPCLSLEHCHSWTKWATYFTRCLLIWVYLGISSWSDSGFPLSARKMHKDVIPSWSYQIRKYIFAFYRWC